MDSSSAVLKDRPLIEDDNGDDTTGVAGQSKTNTNMSSKMASFR